MTAMAVRQQWTRIRARTHVLEREVAIWTDVLANYSPSASPAEIEHAKFALAMAETELAELREILDFWERKNQNGKIPVSVQAGLIAVALYMAIMLLVVVYLLALARG
jgi:hypothetical protein